MIDKYGPLYIFSLFGFSRLINGLAMSFILHQFGYDQESMNRQSVYKIVERERYLSVLFLAHLNMECSVSYCDHLPSVGVRPSDVHPSVHNFLVNTLASTNINQSSPNLVKMYMIIRSRMRWIMVLIGPELWELSALELENLPYLTMFTL